MKKLLLFVLIVIPFMPAMSAWSPVTLSIDNHLRSICYLDDNNVFVAGSEGAILHYNGTDWETVETITDKNLNAIAMTGPTDGWAAGTEGVILRCEAGTWSVYPTEEDQRTYNDILALAEDDVYIIGYNLLEGTILYHWDGTDLTSMHTFADNMVDIEGSAPDDLWVAGGNNAIAHYNGTDWDTSMASFPEDIKIFSLTLTEDGNPLITAVRLPSWDLDMILEHSPETGWSVVWEGFENRIMCSTVNEMRGFAMGSGGRVVENTIFGWQEIAPLGTRQLNDCVLPDMAHGWVVGDLGTLYEYTSPTINLILSSPSLSGGDTFDFQVELLNPGTPVSNVMEIVFLEAYGMIFFWPTWTETFDFETVSLDEDYSSVATVFEFEWPSGAGTGEAAFWGALLDTDNTILGYDIETFTWQD